MSEQLTLNMGDRKIRTIGKVWALCSLYSNLPAPIFLPSNLPAVHGLSYPRSGKKSFDYEHENNSL